MERNSQIPIKTNQSSFFLASLRTKPIS